MSDTFIVGAWITTFKMQLLFCNDLMSAYRRSQRKWFLGSDELHETESYTHLGIVCHKNMHMKENALESASKIRRTFFGLLTSGFCETELHPLTLKRIYMDVNFGAASVNQI